MGKYASKVIAQAQSWLGKKEKDGSFKVIIDTYNTYRPLPRGYAVKYTDEWCATFVSAVAIKLGYTNIIPPECSCHQMIELFKKIGSWNESDSRTPNAGDIIFYDWEDNGSGDNTGRANHVGIVEKASNGTITVIEGNFNESVARRNIAVNGKFIRGYGVPKYDVEPKPAAPTVVTIKKGDKVKVNKGAKSYEGKSVADFVYNNTYTVDQLSGDRAVLGLNSICTAFNTKDLTLAAAATTTKVIAVGSKVKVRKGAKSYEGKSVAEFIYNNVYTVDQLNGKRAVLDLKGICTAFNTNDLIAQ